MIENTIENKKKFMSLYVGQPVYSRDRYPGGENFKMCSFFRDDVEDTHVLLKPLSMICDEDAVSVAKMNTSINWDTGRKEEVWKNTFGHTIVSNGLGLVDKYGQTIVTKLEYLNLEQIDFLRSKGYALPYMGASVETMIEWGWIKLKGD